MQEVKDSISIGNEGGSDHFFLGKDSKKYEKVPRCPVCGLDLWVECKSGKLKCVVCQKVGFARPYNQK